LDTEHGTTPNFSAAPVPFDNLGSRNPATLSPSRGVPREVRLWRRASQGLALLKVGQELYDKLAANFLAMVQLASMRLWLRAYESTA
jgi:hypothetical protein